MGMRDLIQTAISSSSHIQMDLGADAYRIKTNISQLKSSLLNARDAASAGTKLVISTKNIALKTPHPMLDHADSHAPDTMCGFQSVTMAAV
jgi:hypothetical protein